MASTLGRVAQDRTSAMNKIAEGVPPISLDAPSEGQCQGCACGKMCVSKYARKSGNVMKTSSPLEGVHSDLMGPIDVHSRVVVLGTSSCLFDD